MYRDRVRVTAAFLTVLVSVSARLSSLGIGEIQFI